MVRMGDIHSLTGFLRNHKEHLERLATTGRPEVLTVNGKARVVVQDAASYERMLEALDRMDAESILRERIASVERGEPGVPAKDAFAQMRRRLRLKKKT